MSWLRRIALLPLVAGLVLASPVAAAAAPVSDPVDGAVLESAPRQIVLTFTRTPVAETSHVSVVTAGGHPVGEPVRPVRDGLSLTQPVSIAQADDFTVFYVVRFADGGQEQGTRRFSVRAEQHSGHAAHSVDPISAALLVADGLVVVLVMLLLILRRPGDEPVTWRLTSAERNADDRTA